jgi:hypothetical protein
MTLNFENTPAEILEAESWKRGMGPVWRSGFAFLFLVVGGLTLVCGLCGARVVRAPAVPDPTLADIGRHVENLWLMFLPILPLWAFCAAWFVFGRYNKLDKKLRYIKANEIGKLRSITRWLMWGSLVFMVVVRLLFHGAFSSRGPVLSVADQVNDHLANAGAWVGACVVVSCMVLWVGPRSQARVHGLGQPQKIDIEAEGMTIQQGKQILRQPWAEMKRVVETPNLFLIYPSWVMYRIIPKRTFVTPADAAGFHQFLLDWASGRTTDFAAPPVPVELGS